jgi:hypothetical protein
MERYAGICSKTVPVQIWGDVKWGVGGGGFREQVAGFLLALESMYVGQAEKEHTANEYVPSWLAAGYNLSKITRFLLITKMPAVWLNWMRDSKL